MGDASWTVREAKAHLSELIRRARAGEPQRIGRDGDVVLVKTPEATPESDDDMPFGKWLVQTAPRGIDLPESDRFRQREIPFADWDDEP